MHFANQTVIVTGGTGALGRAVVGTLLAAGARCRVPYVVDAEAAAFPHKDGVTLVPRCELTSEDDVARLYDGVTDLWASIHIAGGFAMGSVADTDKAGMLHMLNMNFVTCYLCCRAAVQGFGPAGGRIVNVAARPGLEPRLGAGMAPYAASKAAVAAFTQSLAAEVAGRGILVNADRAIDHRHAGQPRRHAEGRPRRLAEAGRDRRDDRVSRIARQQGDDRRRGAGAGTDLNPINGLDQAGPDTPSPRRRRPCRAARR